MGMGRVVGVLLVALTAPLASGVIVDATFSGGTNGALAMPTTMQYGDYDVSTFASGAQHWGPGYLRGTVTTDTEEDPTVNSLNMVTNDTGFTWTGYIINVYMNKSFSLVTANAPTGWNHVITPVVPNGFVDEDGFTWTHKGTVTYTSTGTSYYIPNGDSAQFDVTFSWLGSGVYQLELIPVPEPASIALLVLGGLFLRRRN